MVGKKNIVFGFLFLVLTAALGPYMAQCNFDDPETLVKIAPPLILLGLLLAGVATAVGFRGEIVRD